jgi:hypothetical protein
MSDELACPLCGFHFVPDVEVCAGCPLRPRCDVACCPHCRYTFPRSSRFASGLLRFLTAAWRRA